MSHFTLLVIGGDVEGKLTPYSENLEVDEYERDCYCIGHKAKMRSYEQAQEALFQRYPILNDIFGRQQGKYEEDKAKAELSSDDREKARFSFLGREPDRMDAFWEYCQGLDKTNEGAGDKLWQEEYILSQKQILEADSEKESPDPNCNECHGTGKNMTTYNPSSKWDWYQIGGRWYGNFVLKDEVSMLKPRQGEPSYHWKPEAVAEAIATKRVDQARFNEIDWEKTCALSDEKLKGINDLWNWIEGKITDEEARERHVLIFYKKKYYLDRYGTREEYIRRESLFTTYAVITEDGVWHGKGEMGWWGMSSDTDNEAASFENGFWDRFLKNLTPDAMLTMVDCHAA